MGQLSGDRPYLSNLHYAASSFMPSFMPKPKDWFLPQLRIAISLWSIGTWPLPRHTNSNDIMDFSHASHRKTRNLWKNLAVCWWSSRKVDSGMSTMPLKSWFYNIFAPHRVSAWPPNQVEMALWPPNIELMEAAKPRRRIRLWDPIGP
jgi:hypothetical protein